MTRITFTLEQDDADRLDAVREQAVDLRRAVGKLEETSGALESWEFVRPVAEALDRLSGEVSVAAVVRESVGVFLDVLRELELQAKLDAGYAQLAIDEEREAVLLAATRRAAVSWADEH